VDGSGIGPAARRAQAFTYSSVRSTQKRTNRETDRSSTGITGPLEATDTDCERAKEDEARRLIRALLSMRANQISSVPTSAEFKSDREPIEDRQPHPVSILSGCNVEDIHLDGDRRHYPTPEAEELKRELARLGVEFEYIDFGGGDDSEDSPLRFLSFNMRAAWPRLDLSTHGLERWLLGGAHDGCGA
jgi:hypothetical protein